MRFPPVSKKSVHRPLLRAFVILGLHLPGSAEAQRESQTLSDSWKFLRQDAALDAATTGWETVTVPHTCNACDWVLSE